MSGEKNVSILGLVRMVLQGRQYGGDQESEKAQDVALTEDRELKLFSPLYVRSGDRTLVAEADAAGILRIRPYEPIFPVTGIGPMPGGQTTYYRSTGAQSRVYLELVNDAEDPDATFTVSKTNGGVTATIAQKAPAPPGVGVRLGPYDLEANGTIQGSSDPGNSVHIHVIVDRFGETGDTP